MDKEVVIIVGETFKESIISDSFSFAVLLLCIYVSQNNTWWTFITTLMLIVLIFAKFDTSKIKRFSSKKELIEWVSSLPDKP